MQISCTVNAQLINAFVFATKLVQSLYFLNMKFQAIFYGFTASFVLDLAGNYEDSSYIMLDYYFTVISVCIRLTIIMVSRGYTVKPVLSDHIKHYIFLAFQIGGRLLLHESSAESFLHYFHAAISNHLSVAIPMSSEWMVA